MAMNTITFPDFVSLEGIDWIEQQKSISTAARESGLFKIGVWELNTGEYKKYDEIDDEEYSKIKDEGDDAEIALIQQGYSKTATPTRYGKDFSVTWEMRNRNKYPETIRRLTNLRKQNANRLELDLSHRLGFGTATSYNNLEGRSVDVSIGDGYALFATAHTLKGSSTTYRNRLAGNPQFSKGSLEAMEKQAVENTYNQFGTKMVVDNNVVWSTEDPNTVNTIREHLKSTAAPSAPNAGVVNVYAGKYTHVILPRLATTANGAVDSTKAKYWGIASTSMTSAYLDIEQEPTMENPSVNSNAEEFSSEDWKFKTRASYSICIVGGKWIQISSGDGTA